MTDRTQQAREFAANTERRLIESLRTGETKCANPQAWIEELEKMVEKTLSGESDRNFTIWQRMEVFLTGECPPLLAPIGRHAHA